MSDFLSNALAWVSAIVWHPAVLLVLLAAGVLFTLWSRFVQFRSLTHGSALVLGRYPDEDQGEGAISHFQALSAALSATVGVGNIGGVALAIALGGPGAVFWMWIVGFLGMSLKSTEVTLSMFYRNTDNPKNPHGGPMWVAARAAAEHNPRWAKAGKLLGGLFCITLLIATFTGGLFFQAWNAATVSDQAFGISPLLTGVVLAVLVGAVILGGISRVGSVAGRLVPIMCGLYLLAALYVVLGNADQIPGIFAMIFKGAFSGLEAQGAFVGGTAGWAFNMGLQRAFFSNEAGQGSSAIAHSAARTSEPVREGLVAGLEPFIDTLVVCTLTAMVILMSGSWNRPIDAPFAATPEIISEGNQSWRLEDTLLALDATPALKTGDQVTTLVSGDANRNSGNNLITVTGTVAEGEGALHIVWQTFTNEARPELEAQGYWRTYTGAALTAFSFDRVQPGLGRWLVTLATWLFALSTMISWSYYGEQGVVFLWGEKAVTAYRLLFCGAVILSCAGLVNSLTQLNNLSNLGTGAMLWVNLPITLLFARKAMTALPDYFKRMQQKG